MRIYTLQIHTSLQCDDTFDELYHFSDFENLKREFDNKFNYFDKCAERMVEKTFPELGEDGVFGSFHFENADGSETFGKVYDYDILDDDY